MQSTKNTQRTTCCIGSAATRLNSDEFGDFNALLNNRDENTKRKKMRN